MSARDKNRKPPHNLVILVFLIILVSAYATRPREPSVRDDDAANEDRCPYAEYDVRSDGNGGFSFAIKRDNEACGEYGQSASETEDGNQDVLTLSEADLLAQERMAHWTLWIGILTGAGLIVLYITFVATRDAVEETRNIGEAQTRAYLAGLSAEYATSDRNPLVVDLTIKNFGQSPAGIWPVSARYIITLLYVPNGELANAKTGIVEQKGLGFSPGTVSAGAEAVMRIRPVSFNNRQTDYPFEDEIVIVSLEVVVRYTDVFKNFTTITINISEQNETPAIGIARRSPLRVTTREGEPGAGRISNEKQE